MALYAFNGTWNSEKTDDVATAENEAERNTNVIRFRNAYPGPLGYYCNGVGTRLSWLGKIAGGAFGAGGRGRLTEAMTALANARAGGDSTIDIIGFSRGAALALAFANRVAKEVRDGQGRAVPIRFLGLWDVVGSFGIPINLGPLGFQRYNVGYTLSLPSSVQHCFHAMALDERRQTFRVTRVAGAYEVWFRGAHSDIGGGNGNTGLNAISLRWMLRKANVAGLAIPESHVLDADGRCLASAAVRFAGFDPLKNAFREVLADDRIHYTVAIPAAHHAYLDPPAGCLRETPEAELTGALRQLTEAAS